MPSLKGKLLLLLLPYLKYKFLLNFSDKIRNFPANWLFESTGRISTPPPPPLAIYTNEHVYKIIWHILEKC